MQRGAFSVLAHVPPEPGIPQERLDCAAVSGPRAVPSCHNPRASAGHCKESSWRSRPRAGGAATAERQAGAERTAVGQRSLPASAATDFGAQARRASSRNGGNVGRGQVGVFLGNCRCDHFRREQGPGARHAEAGGAAWLRERQCVGTGKSGEAHVRNPHICAERNAWSQAFHAV